MSMTNRSLFLLCLREIIFEQLRASHTTELWLSDQMLRTQKNSRDVPKKKISQPTQSPSVWINIFYYSARPATFTKKSLLCLLEVFLMFFSLFLNEFTLLQQWARLTIHKLHVHRVVLFSRALDLQFLLEAFDRWFNFVHREFSTVLLSLAARHCLVD